MAGAKDAVADEHVVTSHRLAAAIVASKLERVISPAVDADVFHMHVSALHQVDAVTNRAKVKPGEMDAVTVGEEHGEPTAIAERQAARDCHPSRVHKREHLAAAAFGRLAVRQASVSVDHTFTSDSHVPDTIAIEERVAPAAVPVVLIRAPAIPARSDVLARLGARPQHHRAAADAHNGIVRKLNGAADEAPMLKYDFSTRGKCVANRCRGAAVARGVRSEV
mmetsp:Transcript_30154/g.99972  ORF Transcript_30154/g.99972 Transcript_30154/m.99972 type:complete len:222 (+) Transcript_30154:767-1432(+)